MKYAFCNEMFGDQPFDQACATMRALGYTGVEIAPFTLLPGDAPCDVRKVSADRRSEVRRQAEAAGLEVVGLHWLLAKTSGYHLTHPQAAVRRATAEYLRELVRLCAELGGKIMVFGSPQQRNLLPGVGYDEAEQHAAEILRSVMPACADHGVTIALEPLGPADGNFMLTANAAIHLAEMVDSPHCKLHLDVKAMASESPDIHVIIQKSRDWLVHFHVNDPNLLGPGMGDVEYGPIMTALAQINYAGWLSLEVFKYEPSPVEIAQRSIEYLQQIETAVARGAES
ncbi:MAG: sugar phosphate isomerase/epimerase [Pirellulales bacterium]|nr:sugar phosphate isomerase/epimerase [Pirellulales bacterium]